MCGICGIRRFGPEPIKEENISILLNMNQRRGNQATGLALQDRSGEIFVHKQDEPAWKVTSSQEYKKFIDEHLTENTIAFIGHARLATLGSPRNNDNNHPVFDGVTAVVHNGHIGNHDVLFKELKLERNGEVDSDIIRAILDEKGFTKEGIETLNRMSGSAAIACLSTKHPGELLLGRSGNPLVLAATDNELVWSSEKQAIHSAMRPFEKKWGFWFQANKTNIGFLTMEDDSAYIIADPRQTSEGIDCLKWHQKFKVANFYRAPDYSDIKTRYNYSRKKWKYTNDTNNQEKPKVAWCSKCQDWMVIPQKFRHLMASELICGTCKTTLSADKKPVQVC